MGITNLETIKAKAGIEIALPGWDNDPFVCKLKRVSVLELAAKGKIPNALMSTVVDIFEKRVQVKKEEDLKGMAEAVNLFCEMSMVEPTYEEVEDINPLTDDQRLAIFDFAQSGVMKIRPSSTK